MNKHNFDKVVSYIWKRAKYVYSEAISALEGISIMCNPDKLNVVELHCYPHFLAVAFNDSMSSWVPLNFYASNTIGGRLQV